METKESKKVFSDSFYKSEEYITNRHNEYMKSVSVEEKEFIEFYTFVQKNMDLIKFNVYKYPNDYKYLQAFKFLDRNSLFDYDVTKYFYNEEIITLFAKNLIFTNNVFHTITFFVYFALIHVLALVGSFFDESLNYSMISFFIILLFSLVINIFINPLRFVDLYSKKEFTL